MDSLVPFLFSWYVLFQVAADLMSIFYCTTLLATLQLYLYNHPSCFTNLYCVGSMNHPRHPMSHCTKLRFLVHILPHLMRCVCQADACFELNLKVWQSLPMRVWVGMKLLLYSKYRNVKMKFATCCGTVISYAESATTVAGTQESKKQHTAEHPDISDTLFYSAEIPECHCTPPSRNYILTVYWKT